MVVCGATSGTITVMVLRTCCTAVLYGTQGLRGSHRIGRRRSCPERVSPEGSWQLSRFVLLFAG